MLTRRLFLGGLLAATGAPAIVRSGVLMPVRPAIIVPPKLYPMEIGRYESVRIIHSDPLGQRGWVRVPGWAVVGSPILNEHWMEPTNG